MQREKSQYSWPWTTVDKFKKREWVHVETPDHYLHQRKDGCWCVIFRDLDVASGRYYKRKNDAVRAFIKAKRKSLGLPAPYAIQLT